MFLSVDELALVKGSQPLVSQAGWQDDFTIYTNPGLIDLQSAPQRILDTLPGVGDANVDPVPASSPGAGRDWTGLRTITFSQT